MHENTTHESDIETLSLSDLPMYSDQNSEILDQEYLSLDPSNASTSISSSSQNDDVFEFFIQELNPSTTTAGGGGGFPPENIIFCGKLIPYKQIDNTPQQNSPTLAENNKKKPSWQLFRWKFKRNPNSKNEIRSTTTLKHKKGQATRKVYNSDKLRKGHGFPVHKMYLFLFGITRFPTEVEMRDMKSRRRSRGRCPPSPPPSVLRYEFGDDKVSGGKKWRLWGLIRALSCG
ncbi:hypothetical protein DH2020_028291 [Rehmannia glutinosa]|uniref:Uncharacterized protein n=1 Tax=Rehmannia glutinosa TaxID=99300 RepID=A0ABR0VVX6_REHGL